MQCDRHIRTSRQEPHASGLEIVNGPDQLDDPFRHSRLAFRSVEQLVHRPPHVRFDRNGDLFFLRQGGVRVWQAGEDALEQ